MRQQLQEAGFQQQGVVVEKKKVRVGSADTFVASMQFPLGMLAKKWWAEDDRAEKLQELNGIMARVAAEEAGEGGEVELEFEGIAGWGWKSA